MGSSAPVNFYAKACNGKFEDENASDSPEEPSWISRRLVRSHLEEIAALESSSKVLPTMPRLDAEWRELVNLVVGIRRMATENRTRSPRVALSGIYEPPDQTK